MKGTGCSINGCQKHTSSNLIVALGLIPEEQSGARHLRLDSDSNFKNTPTRVSAQTLAAHLYPALYLVFPNLSWHAHTEVYTLHHKKHLMARRQIILTHKQQS